MEGLLAYSYDDDHSPSGSPVITSPDSSPYSLLSVPSTPTDTVTTPHPPTTRPPPQPSTPRQAKRLKARKAVRWADPGLLEEVFVFSEDRPVDPNAPPYKDEELEMVTTQVVANGAAPGENGSAGDGGGGMAKVGSFAFHETVSVVRRKRGAPREVQLIHSGDHIVQAVGHSKDGWFAGGGEDLEAAAAMSHAKGPFDPEAFEFFCDVCNYTIEKNEIRYECRECPEEFCLCGDCYDDQGTSHPHDCMISRLPFHVTVLCQTKA